MSLKKPKVALAQDFLANLATLASAVQGKVLKWALRFQSDPTAKGIHYESIQTARDKNLKSVRIDQDWRGIVFKPPAGDVYVLMYVDRHDAAYQWAEGRRIAINPATGALQVIAVEHLVEPAPEQAHPTAPVLTPLFAALADRELLSLGVPEGLLGRVRALHSDRDLDTLQGDLPVEAYEGLFLIAAGDRLADVLAARETRLDRPVDTTDFGHPSLLGLHLLSNRCPILIEVYSQIILPAYGRFYGY